MSTISSTLGWFSRIVTITVELDGPVVTDEGEGMCVHIYTNICVYVNIIKQIH
jgi:hypothetical protein